MNSTVQHTIALLFASSLLALSAGTPASAQPKNVQSSGKNAAGLDPNLKVQVMPTPDASVLLKPGSPKGEQGTSWASIAKLPDLAGSWEVARQPGVGGAASYANMPPLTPAWTEKFKKIKVIADSGGDVPSRAYHCVPTGFGGTFGITVSEFLLTPGRITIIPENMTLRRIYTDGRKHSADPDPTFTGESVGHWENNVLVVDTIGLDPGNEFIYAIQGGKDMHIVEQTSVKDADTLLHYSVLEAPEALTKPYVRGENLKRHRDWAMMDDYCTQNNRDVNSDGTQKFDLTPPP